MTINQSSTKFKKVGGPKKYFKYKECEAGQVLVEGVYIGRTPNKFGKENFDFKPEEGPTVSLNHAGQLAYLIENYVREGDTVQVIYEGTAVLEKGAFAGKEVHNFEVNVAEGDLVGRVAKAQESMKSEEAEATGEINLSDLD